jgi:four helix bundle protein
MEKEDFKKEFSIRLIKFSVSVLKFADFLRKQRTLNSVADQLIRSATSVGANVTEARGASSKRDYIKYFEIALKSGYETQYWFTVIEFYDRDLTERAKQLKEESVQITKILSSSVLTLKGKR